MTLMKDLNYGRIAPKKRRRRPRRVDGKRIGRRSGRSRATQPTYPVYGPMGGVITKVEGYGVTPADIDSAYRMRVATSAVQMPPA